MEVVGKGKATAVNQEQAFDLVATLDDINSRAMPNKVRQWFACCTSASIRPSHVVGSS
jgi:hypothetical protein